MASGWSPGQEKVKWAGEGKETQAGREELKPSDGVAGKGSHSKM